MRTRVFHGGDPPRSGATVMAMTMYLPNDHLRPTGYEPAEFIEPDLTGRREPSGGDPPRRGDGLPLDALAKVIVGGPVDP